MENVNIFILNVGRSGSLAVATHFGLLHEPDGSKPDIEAMKERSAGKKFYGETSCRWTLERKLEELTKAKPNAFYIHLVRDGKKVVNSYMKRLKHYSELAERSGIQRKCSEIKEILPIDGFENMNRFEKLCWYWRYWNEEIEKYADTRIRLEDIQHKILRLHRKGTLFHFNWEKEEDKIFENICGNLNRKYGYK